MSLPSSTVLCIEWALKRELGQSLELSEHRGLDNAWSRTGEWGGGAEKTRRAAGRMIITNDSSSRRQVRKSISAPSMPWNEMLRINKMDHVVSILCLSSFYNHRSYVNLSYTCGVEVTLAANKSVRPTIRQNSCTILLSRLCTIAVSCQCCCVFEC